MSGGNYTLAVRGNHTGKHTHCVPCCNACIDRDGLARPYIGQLRLLVLRHDIGRLQRHDRHQLGAGLDILADPQGAHAHGTVDRRRTGTSEI
jgi:hypothetical protein